MAPNQSLNFPKFLLVNSLLPHPETCCFLTEALVKSDIDSKE